MVGDPRPTHKHFHTILGLMEAQDPLWSCEHHGRNHLPWLLRELTPSPRELTSKGDGSSRYNENYNKRPYYDNGSRDSRGREGYSRRGAGPPYGLTMGRKK